MQHIGRFSGIIKIAFVSALAFVLVFSQLSPARAMSDICSQINGVTAYHDLLVTGTFEEGEVVIVYIDDLTDVFWVDIKVGSQSLTDTVGQSSYSFTANQGDANFYFHVDYATFTVTCIGVDAPASANPAQPFVQRPPDDRANWLSGDNIAAVYVRADANGDPALHIYEVGENSEGKLLMVVTLADVADYAENPPVENLLIASGSGVQVFILNTGELQVNITEPATGKIFVTIYSLSTLESVGSYVLEP